MIHLGIAGCGQLTRQVHLPVLASLPGVRVVAIADPIDPTPHLPHGAKAYPTVEALLTHSPLDAVLVASPTGQHSGHACQVLAANKALYLEKPMAASLEEAATLAATPHHFAMMGFNYRFNPLWQHAASLAAQSPLLAFESNFSLAPRPLPAWKTRRATGGGVLLDLASHHLDFLLHVLRFPVATVSAAISSKTTEQDTASLTLTTADGRNAQCHFSLCDQEIDFLSFKNKNGRFRFSRYEPFSYPLFPPHRFLAYHLERRRSPWKEASFGRSLNAFIHALQTGNPSPIPLSAGLAVHRIIDTAERSAALGRPLPVEQ